MRPHCEDCFCLARARLALRMEKTAKRARDLAAAVRSGTSPEWMGHEQFHAWLSAETAKDLELIEEGCIAQCAG